MSTRVLSVLILCFSSCTPALQQRVAVLPQTWVTTSPRTELDAAAELRSQLQGLRGVEVINVQPAPQPEGSESCVDDPLCAQQVGHESQAQEVLGIKLAELGSTVLVNARLVDAQTGATEQAWQQVVQEASSDTVIEAVRAIGAEVGDRLEAPTPLYARWYLWALIGAAVIAGTAVALTLGLRQAPEQPDITVVPP